MTQYLVLIVCRVCNIWKICISELWSSLFSGKKSCWFCNSLNQVKFKSHFALEWSFNSTEFIWILPEIEHSGAHDDCYGNKTPNHSAHNDAHIVWLNCDVHSTLLGLERRSSRVNVSVYLKYNTTGMKILPVVWTVWYNPSLSICSMFWQCYWKIRTGQTLPTKMGRANLIMDRMLLV